MAFHSILVADDMMETSQPALDEAVSLARLTRAKLTVATVVSLVSPAFGIPMPIGDSYSALLDGMRKRLDAIRERLLTGGLSDVDTVLLEGDPVDRVVDLARQLNPDLIVVGSRGLSAAGRFLLGSVSDGIVHHVHCSVLIVKSPATTPPPAAGKA